MLFNKLRLDKSRKAEVQGCCSGKWCINGELQKNGKYYEGNSESTFYEAVVILDDKNELQQKLIPIREPIILPIKKKNLQTALPGDKVKVTIIEYAYSKKGKLLSKILLNVLSTNLSVSLSSALKGRNMPL